mmetsp:Transcript_24208/g.23784  ORF Transcript_24208/g.23784 Transcript_24208/m.23784 type:complete len:153 (-) Transcript_24208:169-627(-)
MKREREKQKRLVKLKKIHDLHSRVHCYPLNQTNKELKECETKMCRVDELMYTIDYKLYSSITLHAKYRKIAQNNIVLLKESFGHQRNFINVLRDNIKHFESDLGSQPQPNDNDIQFTEVNGEDANEPNLNKYSSQDPEDDHDYALEMMIVEP